MCSLEVVMFRLMFVQCVFPWKEHCSTLNLTVVDDNPALPESVGGPERSL